MSIIAKVGAALQRVFGPCAVQAAQSSGVIVRQRKFTPLSLARTFVLGFLRNPHASAEQLAQTAGPAGAPVTPQAIDQRQTPQLVQFLHELFRRAAQLVIGADKALAPILERFARVIVLDSSTITLPDSEQSHYPGCGGSHGGGRAALKLQTELDLRSGALCIDVEPGRSADQTTARQAATHPRGTLRITDLGYFSLPVFAALVAAGTQILSRLQFGVSVLSDAGVPRALLAWLAQQPGAFVDASVRLGLEQRWPCRLLAWRLPPEQVNRRRQKLRQHYLSKKGREPSAERLAWCDWTILVTSVPADQLSPPEAVVLYRARWQVELLFKRWKSQGLVAQLSGATAVRQMVRVWARLLAALVQHWLVVASAWGDPVRSWVKVSEAVRGFVGRLLAALDDLLALERVLLDLARTVATTCRRNKRSKPGTFELLNDISLLDFSLT